jgi:SOS response regulatory protein OraA/RecX
VSAYGDAVRALARKAYTIAQLRAILVRKQHAEEDICACIERLQAIGYVNDERVAQAFVAQKKSNRGARWLIQAMRHKGIEEHIAQEAVDALSKEEVRAHALTWAKRKMHAYAGHKLYAALIRRGYDASVARWVCDECTKPAP